MHVSLAPNDQQFFTQAGMKSAFFILAGSVLSEASTISLPDDNATVFLPDDNATVDFFGLSDSKQAAHPVALIESAHFNCLSLFDPSYISIAANKIYASPVSGLPDDLIGLCDVTGKSDDEVFNDLFSFLPILSCFLFLVSAVIFFDRTLLFGDSAQVGEGRVNDNIRDLDVDSDSDSSGRVDTTSPDIDTDSGTDADIDLAAYSEVDLDDSSGSVLNIGGRHAESDFEGSDVYPNSNDIIFIV